MSKNRNRRRLRIVSLLTACYLLQGAQCTLDTQQLLPQLVTTIGGVLISGWVNDLFGVQGSSF
jgi:hypothetical protein